jgi:small subunit ribosomal protein S8e
MRSRKKSTGAKLRKIRKKRKMDRGSVFLETRIGTRKGKAQRARSGVRKIKLLSAEAITVSDGKTTKKTKILEVIGNAANIHYVRRNILTKGAVVKTELGPARITSRPGQHGVITAVLIKEKSQK